ncbi:tyrosine-protein phosphatase [Ottowia sp. SB7-C50]|uniref:tyrosine-protein phosphatase n=1 Tax=Ottowia sp. SB7-C50 TaxID=3081231 RepID=UPI002953E7B8|nr:tyrosine-protein phosphatase [Ottowia sp. SB7-C50]WOP16361.1 tyrosine-protein phosphatase [Ottowia sp. SB7-C50]
MAAFQDPILQHPDRSLRLTGASNFRDLGGYAGAEGQTVRWRRLFRSDHLAALTADDAALFRQLGVARSFDFRGATERAAVPYDLPGVTQHPLPIEPTVVQRMKDLLDAGASVTAPQAVGLMQQTYRAFVHDNAAAFASLFEHLVDDDAPLVFHCTAGKDRTGFAAALVLMALGVPRDVVMQDYLLTNQHYRMPALPEARVPREVLDVLWRVQADFLDAALHAVDQDFGGFEAYLAGPLGVRQAQRARLRQLYLAPTGR